MNENAICKVCSGQSIFFAKSRILRKYDIAYFRCEQCGFVQTEDNYWLKEAYTEAIGDNDVGIVSRNLIDSKITQVIITFLFNKSEKFLDYGGGYGLFVRLMRDIGFDFYWFDKYSMNLYARGFEADFSTNYGLVTAFEVFEHFVDPIEEMKNILKFSRNILFTTTLLPKTNPKPGAWQYYELDHGQHISLFTDRSLAVLADHFGLNFYSDHRYLHLMSEKQLSRQFVRLLFRQKLIESLTLFLKTRSLRDIDYLKITRV